LALSEEELKERSAGTSFKRRPEFLSSECANV
jgi:hypothetical protein